MKTKRAYYPAAFILLFLLLATGIFLLGDVNSFDPATIEPQQIIATGKLFYIIDEGDYTN
ncbi:MAG: hypothetical protein FJW69_05685 [Actinobacteria bacterium]|nr:hypothetical protein [Actinomycetota bacterium]